MKPVELRAVHPCLNADGEGHGLTGDPEMPCPNFNCSGEGYTTPLASPAELLEAARPHADLEGAAREFVSLCELGFDPERAVKAILAVALGADDVAAAKAEREERGA